MKTCENKVIFESEEEYKKISSELYDYCVQTNCNCSHGGREKCVECETKFMKQKGYIRKSAVEEAEEMYNIWNLKDPFILEKECSFRGDLIEKLYKAIQELKQE